MEKRLVGELGIIAMRGCEELAQKVDNYLIEWRKAYDSDTPDTFMLDFTCPRFGTGEAKGMVKHSVRGYDIYIIADMFNYGVTYKMYNLEVPMGPDDHFADLKRIIGSLGGKARRINVIMPMLYEGRQHKRSGRESLDCAIALQELINMGASNILTFDAHDARVQNAIPLKGFEDIQVSYQMIKAIKKTYPDIEFSKDKTVIVSPDEGGMSRCIYYSTVLGLDLGMFYKKRNYSVVINGRNPIEAHEYLGNDINGKDVIIIDDMISSGESVLDVAKRLKEKGAMRIFIFASFGLFTNGLEIFDKAFEDGVITRIFTTNMVYRTEALKSRAWYREVEMSKYMAYIIDTLNYDKSLSELLDPQDRIRKILAK
ncbi:MAG: ribose-phosphate pyrophosphokinase [Bacillota bacterium]|nr:ribose-phosphate pyrophosphokinase [Bacillota bacterium]